MLTMVLAPVDRSLSPGSEEMSNPLRIANARSAEGSVPMVSSCSGLSPSSSLWSSSWSEVGRATGWCRSSLRPCLSSNPSLPSLPLLLDSLVSGTRACKADGFSFLMTGLGLHMAPFSGRGVDAIFRRLGGGSWRISVSVSPGRWISRPGVRGNDVTWDATGTSSTIPSMGLDGTGSILSLWRCRGLVWVRRDHYHGSDRRSRLSLLSQSRGLFQPECPTSLTVPGAETSVPPPARHLASSSSLPPVPPWHCESTADS